MGRRIAYLLRRNGTFYFRCRVPADLRESMGRAEVRISLRTTAYDEARRRAATVQLMLFHHFEVLRMREEQKRPRYEPLFASEEIKRIGQEGKEHIFTGSPDEMLALLRNRQGNTYGALVEVNGQRDGAATKARQAETDADEARRALVRAVKMERFRSAREAEGRRFVPR